MKKCLKVRLKKLLNFDFISHLERFDAFLGLLFCTVGPPAVACRRASVGKLNPQKRKILYSQPAPSNFFDSQLFNHVSLKKDPFRYSMMAISLLRSHACNVEI